MTRPPVSKHSDLCRAKRLAKTGNSLSRRVSHGRSAGPENSPPSFFLGGDTCSTGKLSAPLTRTFKILRHLFTLREDGRRRILVVFSPVVFLDRGCLVWSFWPNNRLSQVTHPLLALIQDEDMEREKDKRLLCTWGGAHRRVDGS